jgi:CubicO group peptidase (beta-lactamase class C family)
VLITPRETQDYLTAAATLKASGYRPISVSSRKRAGSWETDFGGIFVKDGDPDDWPVVIGKTATRIALDAEELWDEGYYPFYGWTRNDSGDSPEFNLLFALRPPPPAPDGFAVAARYNMTSDEFAAGGEDEIHRLNKMHLLSADRYENDGFDRYAGIWAKYPPYERWTGTQFDEMDEDYNDKYEMFDERTRLVTSIVGSPNEGNYFRPSATLHIFEGDQLVLNRAYTYAPAIYPDTQLDDEFLYASASKSLTAAAIVREFDDQSLPLSTAFVDTVSGWSGTTYCNGPAPYFPAGFASITIDQILQNQGGFDDGPSNIISHQAIVDGLVGVTLPTADGELPIDGEELLFDLGENETMCAMNPMNSSWRSDLVDSGSLNGTYSNLGYSLLGEVLRQATMLEYDDYLTTNFFDPLNLDSIIPLADHRYASTGPTRTLLRAYMLNDQHPYQLMNPDVKFSSEPPPILGQEPSWEPSADPDSLAPAFAARHRYGGQYALSHGVLPAGGWSGNGVDVGLLLRDLVQVGTLMDLSVADQLWDPAIAISGGNRTNCGWDYGRGFYMRGNWVAIAGGDGWCGVARHAQPSVRLYRRDSPQR